MAKMSSTPSLSTVEIIVDRDIKSIFVSNNGERATETEFRDVATLSAHLTNWLIKECAI